MATENHIGLSVLFENILTLSEKHEGVKEGLEHLNSALIEAQLYEIKEKAKKSVLEDGDVTVREVYTTLFTIQQLLDNDVINQSEAVLLLSDTDKIIAMTKNALNSSDAFYHTNKKN